MLGYGCIALAHEVFMRKFTVLRCSLEKALGNHVANSRDLVRKGLSPYIITLPTTLLQY